jgi:protein-disulfide isomerase
MNPNQPSIKEQRELKRQAKMSQHDDAARRRKMRRIWLWGGGLVALAAIIGGMVYLARPADGPSGNAKVLGLQAQDHVAGPSDAPAVLIEYSDFQCPACGAYYPLVKELITSFGDRLAVVYRHYPLRQNHQNAYAAALASEGADRQGKFWEYHDILFERQTDWSSLPNPRQTFLDYAQELGLDVTTFGSDMDSSAAESAVKADINSGNHAGVNATPSFFLNNQKITNPRTIDEFKQLIEDAIKDRPLTQAPSTQVHLHADIRVVVDGQALDFSQAKYQSTKDKELSPKIHFHSGVGKIFHVHEAKATLGDLFTSLGMKLTNDCFTTDDGKAHCRSSSQALKLFVNGQENTAFAAYEPQDLDQIVLVAGATTPDELADAVAGVTDEACIYSEKCPERGAPPTEECVGGLGTDCE